jgi:hypothetical protein
MVVIILCRAVVIKIWTVGSHLAQISSLLHDIKLRRFYLHDAKKKLYFSKLDTVNVPLNVNVFALPPMTIRWFYFNF